MESATNYFVTVAIQGGPYGASKEDHIEELEAVLQALRTSSATVYPYAEAPGELDESDDYSMHVIGFFDRDVEVVSQAILDIKRLVKVKRAELTEDEKKEMERRERKKKEEEKKEKIVWREVSWS